MTVWTRLKDLVDRVAGHEKPARNFHEDELRLASAALLVHASMIDGQFDASERRKLKALLRERFELGDDEVRRLVREASQEESKSVDLSASPTFCAASSTRTAASGSSRCCGKW